MMAVGSRGILLRQIDRLLRNGTHSGLGDAQLLERYLTGRDESAFEALVDLHGPMVLGICRRMLHDPRDVEDAFQATFLVLVRRASAIRDRGLLSNWLHGVAFRVATRARTRILERRRRETALANLEPSCAPETRDPLGIFQALDQELNRLPAKYRAPLVLCYLKGQTHDQAAQTLRCPVGTVRSRLARGRSLLRRRLEHRGYPSSAGLFGTAWGLPAQLLTEAVPPSLVSATVEAALGLGTVKTIQAGAIAAPVLALTEGVLTTMNLAQFKWIGLGVLATAFSAGSVVAVCCASAPTVREGSAAQNAGAASAIVVSAREPGQQDARPADKVPAETPYTVDAQKTSEERLESLERKVDELLKRLGSGTSTTSSTPANATGRAALDEASHPSTIGSTNLPRNVTVTTTRSSRPQRLAPTFDFEPERTTPLSLATLRELEVQLKLALESFERREQLFRNGSISLEDRETWRGKVLITAAALEGTAEDLDEEIGRVKLEVLRKAAELKRAEAQRRVAASLVQRHSRLNQRKPGMVSDDDVARAEAELEVSDADRNIKQSEIEILRLRLEHLTRRRQRIAQVVALAEPAKAREPALAPQGPRKDAETPR